MDKRIFRLYPVWEFDAEEKWLNKMAAQGWNLTSTDGMNYYFKEGKYTYRLDARPENSSNAAWQSYLDMLNEDKVEHVADYREWSYLRKRKADGPFELYSDLDSRIAAWERIRNRYYVIMVPIAVLFVMFLTNWNIQDWTDIVSHVFITLLLAFYVWGFIKFSSILQKLKKEHEIHE